MDEVKWLMAREIPQLRRYALSLTGDPDTADDLVQDALERAIRKRHLWKRHGSIRSWLYRILYHVFLNQSAQRRKDRRWISLDDMVAVPSEPASQDQQMACKDIAAAMHALPAEQRAAILLIALEGFSYDEAAEILGIPIGTLRSRLSRGRERLRQLYDEQTTPVTLRRVK